MSALATVLDEKCHNPYCSERLMSGTGIRFVVGGMEFAYCNVQCCQTKIQCMIDDLNAALHEVSRQEIKR